MTETMKAGLNAGTLEVPKYTAQEFMEQEHQSKQAAQVPQKATTYEVNGQQVSLSFADVKRYLVSGDPSKVTDQEVMYFVALCKSQKLNPFVKDAYLIKYGTQPAQVVTSCAALEKRAETFPLYEGMDSGLFVKTKSGEVRQTPGSFYDKATETIVGAWADVYRSDRKRPVHIEVERSEFDKGTATWKSMPGVMLRKVAKATALREAFPNENAHLYAVEEIQSNGAGSEPRKVTQRLVTD